MNPLHFFELKSSFEKLKKNHPKFCSFLNVIAERGIAEGTVLECKITLPDGQELKANLKLTEDDIELINKMKRLSSVL